jgi:hypothetical protein
MSLVASANNQGDSWHDSKSWPASIDITADGNNGHDSPVMYNREFIADKEMLLLLYESDWW